MRWRGSRSRSPQHRNAFPEVGGRGNKQGAQDRIQEEFFLLVRAQIKSFTKHNHVYRCGKKQGNDTCRAKKPVGKSNMANVQIEHADRYDDGAGKKYPYGLFQSSEKVMIKLGVLLASYQRPNGAALVFSQEMATACSAFARLNDMPICPAATAPR